MGIRAFMIKNKRGSAIVAAYMAIAVLTTLGTALVSRGIQENKYIDTQRKVAQALYLAEAGAERAKRELYEAFLAYYTAMGQLSVAFAWFDMLLENPYYTYEPPQEELGDGSYSVEIVDVRNPDHPHQ